MFKITKGINNKYVLSLREAYGTRLIAQIATPDELKEAREWVEKFYEGDCKVEALKDLTPQVLKYKNGAVVHAPAHNTDVWYLDSENDIRSTRYVHDYPADRVRLQNKNVFLTKEEAKAYSKRRNVFNTLEKQITIINHENGWVADWSDEDQKKYHLYLNHHENVYCYNYYNCYWRNQVAAYHMCNQAMDWLLSDEVSDEQRKIWVEGV
jgi:hypothetical protein